MRWLIPAAGTILACAGCVQAPQQPLIFSQVDSHVAADNPNCRDYSAQATMAGKPQQIVGRACLQSDGTWKIAEGPAGQPSEFVTVYAPPPAADYSYFDPWFWGLPVGLSLGTSAVFVDRDHRFHHFRFANTHNGFRFGGFHSGFGGSHGGFGGFHGGGFGGMHHG